MKERPTPCTYPSVRRMIDTLPHAKVHLDTKTRRLTIMLLGEVRAVTLTLTREDLGALFGESPTPSTVEMSLRDAAWWQGAIHDKLADALHFLAQDSPHSGALAEAEKDAKSVERTQRLRAEREELKAANLRARSERCIDLLDRWSLLLPAQVVRGELQAYADDIERRAERGQSRFALAFRTLVAILWTGVNTVLILRAKIFTGR